MKGETIERLKKWIELAEEDRAHGDEDAFSSKLLFLRAEVESVLGLRRSSAPSIESEPMMDRKLIFKLAFTFVLLMAVFVIIFRSNFPAAPGESRITASDGISIKAEEDLGSGFAGSGESGTPAPVDLSGIARETDGDLKPSSADQTGSPVGRGEDSWRGVRTQRRRGAGSGQMSAAANSASSSEASFESPLEGATTPVPPAPEPDTGDGASGPQGSLESPEAPSETPRLDPLSLIAVLDSHFE